MNAKRFSLMCLLPLSALALASSGCEVSTCSGDDCDFSFDEDAGPDGSTGGDDDTTDSGTNPGNGDTDGGVPEDGDDAGPDAGDGDGDLAPITSVEEFCDAQFETALDWATTFDVCCDGARPAEADGFLAGILAYNDDATANCINAFKTPVTDGKATFNSAKARDCVEEYLDYFDVPDAGCPATGFDVLALTGQIGHGAPGLRQIAACRATFVGKTKQGEECSNTFECEGDLRCRAMAGTGEIKGCRPAVTEGGECASNNECDDGLTCLGGAGEGVCYPSDQLTAVSAPCVRNGQCEVGLICDATSNTCAEASGGALVCAQ